MLLLNQRTLFLLNVWNFIYVFVELMVFVVIVMYEYYVLLKRKENACDELLFLNFS
jgi:ABC-type multidrug transport system permease subunit